MIDYEFINSLFEKWWVEKYKKLFKKADGISKTGKKAFKEIARAAFFQGYKQHLLIKK